MSLDSYNPPPLAPRGGSGAETVPAGFAVGGGFMGGSAGGFAVGGGAGGYVCTAGRVGARLPLGPTIGEILWQ